MLEKHSVTVSTSTEYCALEEKHVVMPSTQSGAIKQNCKFMQIQPWKLQNNLLSQILRHGTRIGQGSCSSHHSKKIQLQPAPNHPNHHNHQARLWSNTNTTLYQLLTTCNQCSRIMDFQPEEISSTGSTAGNHGSVCPEAFFVLVDWQENPGESGNWWCNQQKIASSGVLYLPISHNFPPWKLVFHLDPPMANSPT